MLRYDAVSFEYPAASARARALCDVSFALAPGESIAVLGANGSGKSTLARLANGIEIPTAGVVTVDGVSTTDVARVFEVRSNVGLVFQHPEDQIVATSVEDDVAFGPENLGVPRDEIRRRVDDAIAAVGLTGLERREPHLLSGGQKQRLAIAGALAMSPRYLVLDEPMSMLDPVGRDEVRAVIESLRDAGHGILLITHDLADVALADRAIVLDRGAVAFEGRPDTLLGEPRLSEWALEVPPVIRLADRLREAGAPVPDAAVEPSVIAGSL